jgi:hypothetical protein
LTIIANLVPPLQGSGNGNVRTTQGCALGYHGAAFQAEWLDGWILST